MSDAMGAGLGFGMGMMMPMMIAQSYQWPSAFPHGNAQAAGYGHPTPPLVAEPRFCGHCGGGLVSQAHFCGHCGKIVLR